MHGVHLCQHNCYVFILFLQLAQQQKRSISLASEAQAAAGLAREATHRVKNMIGSVFVMGPANSFFRDLYSVQYNYSQSHLSVCIDSARILQRNHLEQLIPTVMNIFLFFKNFAHEIARAQKHSIKYIIY